MLAADFVLEAAAVPDEVVLPVVVAAPAVAVAGRDERTESALYTAVRPVALVQDEGTLVAVPLTKFTAAHCCWLGKKL